MIKVKIDGLKVADYWSPTDGWNYDALDNLAKELCDRYREAEAEQTVELFKKYIDEIDPFSIDYIRDQIEWMIRPLMHRGMTMKKRLQINALTYEIVEKLLPSYLNNMAMLHQVQKELEDAALHRYLITPFDKRTAV